MKRLVAFLLVIIILASHSAVGYASTLLGANKVALDFPRTATIEETILFAENNIVITAKRLIYDELFFDIEFELENKTNIDLVFRSALSPYNVNALNGYTINDGVLNAYVAAGQQTTTTMRFKYNWLLLFGMNSLARFHLAFQIFDLQKNLIITKPILLPTSDANSIDDSRLYYQEAIQNNATMRTYGYELKYLDQNIIFDQQDVRIVSTAFIRSGNAGPVLLLEFVNDSPDVVHLQTERIVLNGLVIRSDAQISDTIYPGTRKIGIYNLAHHFDDYYWQMYGIDEIYDISLSIRLLDTDFMPMTDVTDLSLQVSEVNTPLDRSGEVVFERDDIRLLSKTLLSEARDGTSAPYAMLLAENMSEQAIVLSLIDGSLGINGIRTGDELSWYSLRAGQSAAVIIPLQRRLIDIYEIEQIREISFGIQVNDEENQFIFEERVTINY